MNIQTASFVIVAFLALAKVLSVYWIFVILSCLCIAVLTVFAVFLATVADETSVKKKLSRNPLDEHKIHTRIGINCKLPLNPMQEHRSLINCSSVPEDETKSEDLSTYSRRIKSKSITGNKRVDELVGNLLDYVFRDYVESWFQEISNNKTFPNESRRNVEHVISDLSNRVNRSPLLSVLTTKVIDDIAAHVKVYNFVKNSAAEPTAKKTPKITSRSSPFHRRNKSDTDASFRNWNLGSALIHKKVANSTFYSVQTDEELLDPDKQFIETFFDNSEDNFRDESKCDKALEKHLAVVVETILYYSVDSEVFKCDISRQFLISLLAGLMKLLVNMLSDPDFINTQIAHLFANDPPPSEFLIREIRNCNDLSELRAVRHLITREMDLKHRIPKYAGEIASLKFTQNEIDKKISAVQSFGGNRRSDKDKFSSKSMRLTLDEIFNRELAMSYFLDYLSILNLQKYVIFYRQAQEWKNITQDKLSIGDIEVDSRRLRDTAFNLYTEYLLPSSSNYLKVDQGLIDVLHIKIMDTYLVPDPTWFDSICRFIYEKIKNEEVFLSNFYESPAYKKLLLELEEIESEHSLELPSIDVRSEASDTNSDDLINDDEFDFLSPVDAIKNTTRHQRSHSDTGILVTRDQLLETQQRLTAKIFQTAINSNGNFAVYAIEVYTNEKDSKGFDNKRSWHIYHRYSRFLELKKLLLRRFPSSYQNITLPFPKKQTFHNTNRNLIERRMVILNEFLRIICSKAEHNEDMHRVILGFLKFSDDGDVSQSKSTVSSVKAGLATIKNMPESLGLFDGLAKLFQKNNEKADVLSDEIDTQIQLNAEFPALISFVNLIDVVFGLGTKSQWLKKAISGIMAAPFVSQSINKRILEIAQKHILEADRVETVLGGILNGAWPNGIRQDPLTREDTTKLRTRMAARVTLFAFLSGELITLRHTIELILISIIVSLQMI